MKIKHPVYQDYPEQPYISKERDLQLWTTNPELFPYQKVDKSKMKRLPEGVLAGDIILLWRINFDNFTNQDVIPQYFEYRYGVDTNESIKTLIDKAYIIEEATIDSLYMLNIKQLKTILKEQNLSIIGKKKQLLYRIKENITKELIEESVSIHKYTITDLGKQVLSKYKDIVKKHGPKT